MDKKAFSLVEMIITITLLVLLATVGFSMAEKYQQNKTNTKVEADLATLSNAFTSYKAVEKKYPDPIANKSYFTDEGMYSHDETSAFGVHGFITSETLPNKYLNFVPVDIKTNQYYAFGKTMDESGFEIAGVLQKDGVFMSKVYGDYTGETGPFNLIREYNGPSFVADESTENFPYNPDEKLLTAKIGVYSGSISLNGTPLPDEVSVTSAVLRQGDTLTVGVGSFAQIYYSDGSTSTLGDDSLDSTLIFANMVFVEDNNLYTQIKLALQVGSLWTNAAKLDSKSSFEVYTTDTSAAVRGTVFGVTKEPTSSTITVEQGKVKVDKITESNLTNDSLADKLNAGVSVLSSMATLSANITTSDSLAVTVESSETILKATTTPVSMTINSPNTSIPKINLNEIEVKIKEKAKKHLKRKIFRCNNGDECDETTFNAQSATTPCGQEEIEIAGECVNKTLSGASDYELVAYAPYNTSGDLTLYGTGFSVSSGAIIGNTSNLPGICISGSIPSSSFCKMASGSGVYVDSNDDDDYIKYSGLNLGSDFAIEIRARVPGTNPGDSRFLFQLGDMKLQLQSTGIPKVSGSNGYFTGSIAYNDLFQTFTLVKNGSTYLYNDGNLIGSGNIGGTPLDLFIGSSSYISPSTPYKYQYNNIIDYVKIYKKNP